VAKVPARGRVLINRCPPRGQTWLLEISLPELSRLRR
jgi:hypothetical protein